MSPFLSQNTTPDYWPGKNLLGAILTELTNELPNEPMDANRESSSENEHENGHVKNNDEDDEDDNDEYEDAQQEDIVTQAEEFSPDMPAAAQTIHNSVMSLTTDESLYTMAQQTLAHFSIIINDSLIAFL